MPLDRLSRFVEAVDSPLLCPIQGARIQSGRPYSVDVEASKKRFKLLKNIKHT